jgi:hypothetical protein
VPIFIEVLFEFVLPAIGWAVMKVVTLGRYRSSEQDASMLFEGTVGFGLVALVIYFGYSIWPA